MGGKYIISDGARRMRIHIIQNYSVSYNGEKAIERERERVNVTEKIADET